MVKKVNANSAKTLVVKGRDTLKTSSCQNIGQQYCMLSYFQKIVKTSFTLSVKSFFSVSNIANETASVTS